MFSFITMKQGITESDDDYLTRFNSRCKNLELAGGQHIFCSPAILKKKIQDATEEEIRDETERFKAM